MKKSSKKSSLPYLLLAGAGAAYFIRQLLHVSLTRHTVESEKIPAAFDGYKVLHLSDLHNNRLLCRDDRLLERIKRLSPDIIVFTGDIIDSLIPQIELASDFASKLTKICDVYYAPGNHEARIAQRDILFRQLKNAGVKMLFDSREEIEKGGDIITVTGLMDPKFERGSIIRKTHDNMHITLKLRELSPIDETKYNILLSHKPEHFSIYANYHYDLIMSGHAHGGQWRFPFFGAVFSPGQGLFPAYTSGMYTTRDSTLIVSRGLGNTKLPLRINNPFELVLVTLKKTEPV
ncbi:MAG: metallophosphoesterase [Oscillospiraceae bacterium]|nr:metallophosphoesterase [Oscillospiraceae bacterium]